MVTKWGVSGTKMSYLRVMVGLSKLDSKVTADGKSDVSTSL